MFSSLPSSPVERLSHFLANSVSHIGAKRFSIAVDKLSIYFNDEF